MAYFMVENTLSKSTIICASRRKRLDVFRIFLFCRHRDNFFKFVNLRRHKLRYGNSKAANDLFEASQCKFVVRVAGERCGPNCFFAWPVRFFACSFVFLVVFVEKGKECFFPVCLGRHGGSGVFLS